MNRQILFRGKTSTGEWVFGDLIQDAKTDWVAILPIECGKISLDSCIEVIPQTVGQFTGITDKNGVKIFEGQSIKVIFSKEQISGSLRYVNNSLPDYLIGVVKYIERSCSYIIEFEKNNPYHVCSQSIGWYSEDFEVIGTIHDKQN